MLYPRAIRAFEADRGQLIQPLHGFAREGRPRFSKVIIVPDPGEAAHTRVDHAEVVFLLPRSATGRHRPVGIDGRIPVMPGAGAAPRGRETGHTWPRRLGRGRRVELPLSVAGQPIRVRDERLALVEGGADVLAIPAGGFDLVLVEREDEKVPDDLGLEPELVAL